MAVHLACQSLLNGECEVALAGGVSIAVPQRIGYLAVEGGLLAPDGHCRAFDARARGTVSGEGVGVVVLKRLEDALAARDAIRAVIKGSAINNDGSGKVGFTAPSPAGQARVIRAAHVVADVVPATISYAQSKWVAERLVLEARGRGIPIGVYRPDAVMGDTRTGACRTDDAVWRLLKGCIQLGAAPDIETHLAGAPVDYVSSAIVHLAQQPAPLNRAFHLVAPDPVPWREVFAAAAALGYPLRHVSYPEWRELLRAVREDEDNALFPLVHLFDRPEPSSPRFGCSNTLAGLASSDIACPPLDEARLRQYLAHFIETGFLEPPPRQLAGHTKLASTGGTGG